MGPPGRHLFPAHRFMLSAAGTPDGLSDDLAVKYEPADLEALQRWGYIARGKGNAWRLTEAGAEALAS